MRDDRGAPRIAAVVRAAAAAALLLAVLPPNAGAVPIQVQGQYVRSEQSQRIVQPDGSFQDRTAVSEYWRQTVTMRKAFQLPRMWTLSADARWSDQYYIGQAYRKQVPSGSLRLNHAFAGFNVSYQPEAVKSIAQRVSPEGAAGRDSSVSVTSRRQNLNMSAFTALPGLPRLDLSWARQHQNRDALFTEGTSVTRRASMIHQLGPWSLRGGYSDLASARGTSSAGTPFQRAWDVQTGAGFSPWDRTSVGFQYDLNAMRRTRRQATIRSLNHGGSVSAAYRASDISDWGLGYTYRRGETKDGRSTVSNTHSGALTYGYRPIPGAQLGASAGLQSAGSRAGDNLVKYAGAHGRYSGSPRRGWRLDADAARSLNWNPQGPRSTTDQLGAHGELRLRRNILLNTSWQMAANSQPPSPDGRVSIGTSLGLVAQPLPGVGLTYSESRQRNGARWNRPAQVGRGRTLNASWDPTRSLTLGASLSQAGPVGGRGGETNTGQYSFRWIASRVVQLSGLYARSTSGGLGSPGTDQSRESYGGRVSGILGGSINLNAGFTVAEHGRPNQSRNFDVSATKTFGR